MSTVYVPANETTDITVESAQKKLGEVLDDAITFFEEGPKQPAESVCRHVRNLGNAFVSRVPVEATNMLKFTPPVNVFNALSQLTKEGEFMLWRRNLVQNQLCIGIDCGTIYNSNNSHEIFWKVRVHDVMSREREELDVTHFKMVSRGINFEILSSQCAVMNKHLKKKGKEAPPGMAGSEFAKAVMDIVRSEISKEEMEVRVPTQKREARKKENEWKGGEFVMQPDANCDKEVPQVHEILSLGPEELDSKFIAPAKEPEVEPMVGDPDTSSKKGFGRRGAFWC